MTFEDQDTQRAEYSSLLDEADGKATAATLGSIVARSRRHRERRLKVITGISILLALAGASVAGITRVTSSTTSAFKPNAIGPPSESGQAPLANSGWTKQHRALGPAPKGLEWLKTTAPSTSTGASSSGANIAATPPAPGLCTVEGCGNTYPVGLSGPLIKLFVQTFGDVTVRAFQETTPNFVPQPYASNGLAPPTSSSAASPNLSMPSNTARSSPGIVPIYTSCESSQALVVEVSNPGAVGAVTVPLPSISISGPSQPFEILDSSAVGVSEASPIEVLTVHVASDVSSVQASFSDGISKQMAVVSGWAVFADDGSTPLPAAVTALDSSGNTIATATINDDDAIAQPQACLAPIGGQSQTGPSAGQPTTSSK
ncbi:MAG TPA: hypothetical protein VNE42_10275 [Acidimicrobiales bacterium]|nr:hypothetical protein [Acidimicrobiales bacterium]